MSNKFHDIFAYIHKVFYTSFSQLVASQGEGERTEKRRKQTSEQADKPKETLINRSMQLKLQRFILNRNFIRQIALALSDWN